MKLKPIRLFGVEQNRKNCYFIHEDGSGFWFISHKQRTVGEAFKLNDVATEIENLEISSNWLLLEIVKGNREALLEQIKEKDFKVDFDLNGDTDRLIEIYVRTLISDLDFVNPVIWKYKDRLEANISKNRELFFNYQISVVQTIFECRVINDPTIITPDDTDIEKGYVQTSQLTNRDVIGLKEPFNYDDLSETLALKIYQYANVDFAGKQWETTAMIEARNKKDEPKPIKDEPIDQPNSDDEKKTLALLPVLEK